ncbi:response regulator [Pararhizobium sp. DWP1-1-3]|uniref:response regulator n=1 Tax=Pararhizobium sp. DWP1-1-3 TaxID=2804652 RepID=UPI003CEB138D
MGEENLYPGKRILVVEDDYFIAQQLVDRLERTGAIIVGPAPNLDRALAFASGDTHIDAAILDINLNGDMAFPVADLLFSRGVPFVFATGYDDKDIPARYESVPRLSKPVEHRDLQDALFRR